MSELVMVDEDSAKKREDVALLMMEGKSPRAVAMKLGMKIVEVNNYYSQWKEIVKSDMSNKDMADEHLHRTVSHYDRLISESYAILEDLHTLVFDEKVAAQRNTTLKNISEYEMKRVDMLQKAGLIDGADLGDELAIREEREAAIIGILQHDLCQNCKDTVRDKMTALTGVVQGSEA